MRGYLQEYGLCKGSSLTKSPPNINDDPRKQGSWSSLHILQAVKKFRVSSGSLDKSKSREQFLYIVLGMEGLCAKFQGLSESLRLFTSSLLCCLLTGS